MIIKSNCNSKDSISLDDSSSSFASSSSESCNSDNQNTFNAGFYSARDMLAKTKVTYSVTELLDLRKHKFTGDLKFTENYESLWQLCDESLDVHSRFYKAKSAPSKFYERATENDTGANQPVVHDHTQVIPIEPHYSYYPQGSPVLPEQQGEPISYIYYEPHVNMAYYVTNDSYMYPDDMLYQSYYT